MLRNGKFVNIFVNKIQNNASDPKLILTVQGVGYTDRRPTQGPFTVICNSNQKVRTLMPGSFIERCLEAGLHVRDCGFENYLKDVPLHR